MQQHYWRDKMIKISTALVKAQKEFAPALKTATNPHFKSKYVGLDGCVEAVIDALNSNGIYLMQKTHDCETGVKIETIFIHESGEQLSGGILHVPATKNDAQGYGSCLTYARRYSLMSAAGIAPEDDDGNAASKQLAKIVFPLEMWTEKLNASTNVDELHNNYLQAKEAAVKASDQSALKAINAKTSQLKTQLNEAA